ncbi:MAG: FtsK/SpoIIIE domain-containing protein [Acidimicrobiales bacterium]
MRTTTFDRKKMDRTPTVTKVRDTPAGYSLRVRVPPGTSVTDLENAAEVAAAAMGVADLRITRDRAQASVANVAVIRRDPLAGPALPWPLAGVGAWSLWDPIPVGLDDNGHHVEVSLPEHNVLIGGEPGAGKSAALSLLVAAAALDPTVTLWLFDGKLVELASWQFCTPHVVGPSLDEAIAVLDHLREEMDTRYAELLAWTRRKIAPDDGLGLHVVVIDELALYLATGERKTRDRLAESLRDLIARGRAAGVIVLAATQRPSSDIVPTSVRDLFGFRWAMRCATRDASDTILGAGWAAEGYSASDIDATARGVGYLLHEGGVPVRMRAAYLDDASLAVLAARAAWNRGVQP